MEFALSTYLFADERLNSHLLDQILQAGIRHIEIFAARQHLDYHDTNHVRDVAQWFSDHSLTLHSVHAPLFSDFDWGRSGGLPVSVAYSEKRLRIDSMDEIKRAIDIAERVPFRYLILHLGLLDEEYNLQKFDAAFTSVEHLKMFAKARGVRILLENIPNKLSTSDRLVQFIHYTRLDDLKICFDTGHAHMAEGIPTAFRALKDLIVSTHVHDNRREKDDHSLPFDGEIDWNQTVQDFREVDGQFPLLFELRNYGAELSSFARLREVMGKLEAIR